MGRRARQSARKPRRIRHRQSHRQARHRHHIHKNTPLDAGTTITEVVAASLISSVPIANDASLNRGSNLERVQQLPYETEPTVSRGAPCSCAEHHNGAEPPRPRSLAVSCGGNEDDIELPPESARGTENSPLAAGRKGLVHISLEYDVPVNSRFSNTSSSTCARDFETANSHQRGSFGRADQQINSNRLTCEAESTCASSQIDRAVTPTEIANEVDDNFKQLEKGAAHTPCAVREIEQSNDAEHEGADTQQVITYLRSRAKPLTVSTTRKISWAEVRRHTSCEDCWLVAHGKVYDVTQYLFQHPGGADALLRNSGGDCSAHFAFHPKDAQKLWANYQIGVLRKTVRSSDSCVIS